MTPATGHFLKANLFSGRTALLKALLFCGMALCFLQSATAQGWEIYFGGNAEDFGQSVIQTQDHGYAVAGFSESFGADGDMDVYVIRTDVDGTEIWSNVYDDGFVEHGYSIIQAADGGFLVAGDILTPTLVANAYLLKIDADGQKVWTKQFGGAANDRGYRIIPVSSGGYLIAGSSNSSGNGQNDVFLVRVDEAGDEIWSETYGTAEDDFGRGVVEVSDGFLVTGAAFNEANQTTDAFLLKVNFAGEEEWLKFFGDETDIDEAYDLVLTSDGNVTLAGYTGSNSQAYLLKTDLDGNEIWTTTLGGDFIDQAYDLLETGDGGLVLAGITEVSIENIDVFLAKTDAAGNELWKRNLGRNSFVDFGQSVAETEDKGFIVTGYNSLQFAISINDVTLIKANADGDAYTGHLTGKVHIDQNDNCQTDAGEPGLNDWIVRAESNDLTFFGTTDAQGNFDITLDTGLYEVTILLKNDYWQSCVAGYNVSFTSTYDTLLRNFPMLPLTDCPLLEVDISSPVVQNCANIGYVVSYCNHGTVAADMPSVQVIFGPGLTLTSASLPWVFNQDSLYIFEVDTLSVDECGSFYLTAASDCEGVQGQAYTASAHIFPDSICLPAAPGWDLAEVQVNGFCETDSVKFILKNEGIGDMEQPQNFIVIEDQILKKEEPFQLDANESKTVSMPGTGGTFRIIAEQSPGHPGNSYPTVAVEGCTGGSTFSTGYTTMFHEDEGDAFTAVDAQESIAAPTDYIILRGYPKGYLKDGQHLIPANTGIEYHIFFQNAGADSIHRLVIRDTLPSALDLRTVVAGAASHPYEFEAYSNGVLKFTFEDIQLPPGGGAASQGFVNFTVSQKPDNPEGTVIPNSAAVFLGYDAPRQTATYTHVVGGATLQDFIVITDTEEPAWPGVRVNAYPNPFAAAIEFEINDNRHFNNLTLYIFDLNGRPVCREVSTGHRLRLPRRQLAAGTYAYRLEGDGQLLDTGKIIVR